MTVPLNPCFWDFPGGPVVKTLCFTAAGVGSILGQGTKNLHVVRCGQRLKEKKKICFSPMMISDSPNIYSLFIHVFNKEVQGSDGLLPPASTLLRQGSCY